MHKEQDANKETKETSFADTPEELCVLSIRMLMQIATFEESIA